MNSPMNPTGKVFALEELEHIADLLIRHDAYAICDEVYEHLIFDGREHIPLMTLPNMRERCIRIGSAGKTFSMTGWKVGYVTAAPELMAVVSKAHQFLVFTTPPNLRRAVAYGLDEEEPWYTNLSVSLEAKRDLFAKGLAEIGFDVLPTHGTYFVSADFRPLGINGTDVELCRQLTIDAKVTPVPVSAFFAQETVEHLVRFSFCKKNDVLEEALRRLGAHFGG